VIWVAMLFARLWWVGIYSMMVRLHGVMGFSHMKYHFVVAPLFLGTVLASWSSSSFSAIHTITLNGSRVLAWLPLLPILTLFSPHDKYVKLGANIIIV
jgi:hypothetical protein